MDIASPLQAYDLVAGDGSFFDRLTSLATSLLRIPVAMVSIVEKERQVFPSRCVKEGPLLGVEETPISHSICAHVVRLDEPLIIQDTRVHPLTEDNPAVGVGVLAYAGFPLKDAQGRPFGAFCAIDYQPHEWTENDVIILRTLALQVASEFQLRAALSHVQADFARLNAIENNRAKINRANRHDLRTPLNAMLLGLEAVEQFGEINAEQKEYLEMSRRNGLQLMVMVDQMLDIGNIDSLGNAALHRRPAQAADLLAAALDQTTILAQGKDIRLSTRCGPGTALLADHEKVVRVLVNLISNAIKFTPPGGQVDVRIAATATAEPAAAPQVRFEVADSGIGIPASHLDLIFNEGYRVNPEAATKDSTGLGLAFCKAIVEAHGGHIGVTSQEGEGSVFHFTLAAGA